MSEQNNHINSLSELNSNNFWLTQPPPFFTQTQNMTPMYNVNYRAPFPPQIPPHASSCYKLDQSPTPLPYSCDIRNINYQDQYLPYNQITSNSFPPLPENIDEEYILKYICPLQKPLKDETTIWIENWLANKDKEITTQKVKPTNVKVNEISKQVKECKILLEHISNIKQLMEQNLSTMTTIEWNEACFNLFSIQERVDTLMQNLNLDNSSVSELNKILTKRRKKRDRLKRLKSNLKIIKSQQKDEIREINRKIDAWQNNLKENLLKEKRVDKTKIEANIVLKGVRGKIDDAKNQISLFDTLEKLRKCRLQNCINQRKNPILEESLNKLKLLWQQKLTNYEKEEEELKNMLSKSEAEKHEKREVEIQEKLDEWDQLLFGPYFRSHEIIFDDLQTFLNIRRDWDKYAVNENETPASSSIPVGWILPSTPCNSDWAKYLNNIS